MNSTIITAVYLQGELRTEARFWEATLENYEAAMSSIVVCGQGYIVLLDGEEAGNMLALTRISPMPFNEMRELAAHSTCRRSAVFSTPWATSRSPSCPPG